MKPHAFATLVLALVCLFPSDPLRAERASFSFELLRATDADSLLRGTELKVALRQYEKVLMDLMDARLEEAFGPADGGSKEQLELWHERAKRKIDVLDSLSAQLRTSIYSMAKTAEEKAKAESGINGNPRR